MESKYGRLFTEAEVGEFIRTAFEMGLRHGGRAGDPRAEPDGMSHPDLFEVMAAGRHRATFPADEPLFLLRGQDRTAADNVEGYANLCQHICSPEHVQAARDAAAAMRRFRAEHPDRVKVPD